MRALLVTNGRIDRVGLGSRRADAGRQARQVAWWLMLHPARDRRHRMQLGGADPGQLLMACVTRWHLTWQQSVTLFCSESLSDRASGLSLLCYVRVFLQFCLSLHCHYVVCFSGGGQTKSRQQKSSAQTKQYGEGHV